MAAAKTRLIESAEAVHVSDLGDGHCVLDLQGAKTVLSYDAAFDLAMKFAHWLQKSDETERDEESLYN